MKKTVFGASERTKSVMHVLLLITTLSGRVRG